MTTRATDHKQLRALKYAFVNDEYTQDEISQAAGLTVAEFRRYGTAISVAVAGQGDVAEGQRKYQISPGAFMNYLEYVELEEARQSSKTAKRLAIGAILISAVLAIASIAIALIQAMGPNVVEIQESQVDEIEALIVAQTQEVTPANEVAFLELGKSYWVPCAGQASARVKLRVLEIGVNGWVRAEGIEDVGGSCLILNFDRAAIGWWNVVTGQAVIPSIGSVSRRGMMTWDSGSPNRQLNSRTLGPASVNITPA